MNASSTSHGTRRRALLALSFAAAGVALPAGAASAADFGVYMYDWNQDGYVDTSTLDLTGDGWLDANLVQFADSPGWTWLVDLNQNADAELVGYDANRDGVAEVWFVDANEDGFAEAVSRNGHITTSASIMPDTYGTSSGGGGITLTPNSSGGLDIAISMDQSLGYVAGGFTDSAATTSTQQFPYGNLYGCRNLDDWDRDGTVDCLDRTVRG